MEVLARRRRIQLLILASLLSLVGCGVTPDLAQPAATQPATSSTATVETSTPATDAVADDPAAGSWELRAPLLEPNSELAAAELDGKVYLMGGYPASRRTVSTVQIYDSATDSWSLGEPLPVPTNHNVAVAVDGKVYSIGGQPTAQGSGPFHSGVYAYDPATATWTERAPMPTGRSATAAAVIDGKIYVAGGRPPQGHDFAVYDPALNEWTTLPDMPTARNHFIAVAIDGEFYAVGGRFGAGFASEVTDVVEIYNPQTNEWRTGVPMPTKRSGHNGIVAYGCLHIMGGEGNGEGNVNGMYPQHEVYNPLTQSWLSVGEMPTPMHGVVGMAFIDGWIHFPGGGDSQGGSSGSTLHQVYRPALSCE